MKHIYTGDGKGKTTAAVGLAVRCAGSGKKVLFTQFLKPATSGELKSMQEVNNLCMHLCPTDFGFTWNMSEREKEEAALVYEHYIQDIVSVITEGNYAMLIMDEVIGTINAGLIHEEMLMKCLEQLPDDMEIVLTGRNPGEALILWADYMTEMKKIKHPFDQGIKARKGIEY